MLRGKESMMPAFYTSGVLCCTKAATRAQGRLRYPLQRVWN